MAEPTDVPKVPDAHEAGRVLTPEEADFLKKYLLSTEPVVVTGTQKKGQQAARKPPASKR